MLVILFPVFVHAQEYVPDWGYQFGITSNQVLGTITKTETSEWGNSGVISHNKLGIAEYGYVEFEYQGGDLVFGLSKYDIEDFGEFSVQHCVHIVSGNADLIIEDEALSSVSLVAGDVIKIDKSEDGLSIYVNGVLKESKPIAYVDDLHVKATLYTNNATIESINSSFSSYKSVSERLYFTSSDPLISFNWENDKFVQEATTSIGTAMILSRNKSFPNESYVGFYLPEDFEGAVGLDVSTTNTDPNLMVVSFRVAAGKASLNYYGEELVNLGDHYRDDYYELLNDDGTIVLLINGLEVFSIDLPFPSGEYLKVLSDYVESDLHFSGFETNMEWSRNPIKDISIDLESGTDRSIIQFNTTASDIYYLWGGAELMTESEHEDYNDDIVATYDTIIENDSLFILDTLSYDDYLDTLAGDTMAYSYTPRPYTLKAEDALLGETSLFTFSTPHEFVPDKYGGDLYIEDGNVFTQDVNNDWSLNSTIFPLNTVDVTEEYSGFSFEVADLNSVVSIGIVDDSWTHNDALPLPTIGFYLSGGDLSLISNGSVATVLKVVPGDELKLIANVDGVHLYQNEQPQLSVTVRQERFASIIALDRGGVKNVRYYSPAFPTIAIENTTEYCGLKSTPSFTTELIASPKYYDLPVSVYGDDPDFKPLLYNWLDKDGNIVSNEHDLSVTTPGIYTLSYLVGSNGGMVWTEHHRSYLIGYSVEWDEMSNTVAQPNNHSVQPVTGTSYAPPLGGSLNSSTYALSYNERQLTEDDFVYFQFKGTPVVPAILPTTQGALEEVVKFSTGDANYPYSSILRLSRNYSWAGLGDLFISINTPYYSYSVNPTSWNTPTNLPSGTNDLIAYYDASLGVFEIYLNGQFLFSHDRMAGGNLITGSLSSKMQLRYDYLFDQIIGSSDFIFSEGIQNIIYSRKCNGVNYYDLQKKPNTNTVYSTGNVLGIRYYEDYTLEDGTELTFTIYNENGDEESIPSGISYTRIFGENRILFKLDELGLLQDATYLLEVENDKHAKRYLRFKY